MDHGSACSPCTLITIRPIHERTASWLPMQGPLLITPQVFWRRAPGRAYCVGGSGSSGTASERTNKQVVEAICGHLDQLCPAGAPHARLITPVTTSHLAPRHKVQPIFNGDVFCDQKIMPCRKWHRDLEQSSRDEGNHHHDELSLDVIW
jgi:hypothetical protein